jgi:hypothetical protein
MKKTVVVVTSMFAILLSACSQIPGLGPAPVTGPTVDTSGTSVFQTAVVQTLTAQPTTLPPVSATDTATLPVMVESPTLPPATDTQVVIPTLTFTPVSNPTSTLAAVATATSGSANAAATATATLAPGQVTASPTNGILKYGTQPPAIPFNRITLSNKAKAEAYISLQVTMPDGKFSILEYPVEGTFKIEAPIGSYLYVAWVGGRKMVGTFRLNASDELLITLYKSKVVIK